MSEAAVKNAGVRATKASAKLEGRVIPVDHRRSAAVKAYLEKQQPPKRKLLQPARRAVRAHSVTCGAYHAQPSRLSACNGAVHGPAARLR
ncbi:hypothetical protein MAGR_48060 [Mycolicibacterium agri]|uniref:Uncharacterized protein n=1 Tax=Mycolicibacterium agri TaxID=36811 RepID=A0A7I9W6N6_MYCAG|nr:hypothetical protein MAGR_48060 [Mycolicibacterium agri]